ncbi:MAG TPA: SigE family RNA polymerase sigma factor [Micromonosporaceae bacterium]
MDDSSRDDFTAFVTARGHALLRSAYALCGNRHTAEDLVQSALAKAASRWTRIHGEPENYVRTVLYREFVSGWRQRRRRPENVMAELPEDGHRDHADATTDRVALRQLIATLPPRQRAVIVLRYLEDMSVDQVAEILGCTRGTVSSQATRALAHLRRSSPTLQDDRAPMRRPFPLATRGVNR